MPAIAWQGQPGADANLEHASLALVDNFDCVAPALRGETAEGVIIDRGPPAVGALDGRLVHLADRGGSSSHGREGSLVWPSRTQSRIHAGLAPCRLFRRGLARSLR